MAARRRGQINRTRTLPHAVLLLYFACVRAVYRIRAMQLWRLQEGGRERKVSSIQGNSFAFICLNCCIIVATEF